MSEGNQVEPVERSFQIYTEHREDGWYVVAIFPKEASKFPVTKGPFETEAIADERYWQFLDAVKNQFGDRIKSILVRDVAKPEAH